MIHQQGENKLLFCQFRLLSVPPSTPNLLSLVRAELVSNAIAARHVRIYRLPIDAAQDRRTAIASLSVAPWCKCASIACADGRVMIM